ncbi:MAG TPA: hypothetical protein VFO91_00805 [Anaerolineales bacterium]|nr:hypothetical protein [Anaerolineales bacterium]
MPSRANLKLILKARFIEDRFHHPGALEHQDILIAAVDKDAHAVFDCRV